MINLKRNNHLSTFISCLPSLISRLPSGEGFTLIEMLAVMVVFASIGTIIISTIFISLRGSKKSDSVTSVRQNGNFALSQMVKTIRYAKTLDNPYPCVLPPPPTPVPSYQSITVTGYDNSQTTFTCTTGLAGTISQNNQSLLDTSSSGVSVSSCSITCSQNSESTPPTVSISFTLSPRTGAGSADASTAIPFETSVTLRNVSQ